MHIVAVVGTMPFPRMIRALAAVRHHRPELSIWVQHAGGGLADGLDGAPFEDRARILVRMREADAVVCHGGSGTVRDAISAGHAPVVIPRLAKWQEHVNDHQMEIEEAFSDAIVFVPEPEPAALLSAIEAARLRRGKQGGVVPAPGPLAEEIARILQNTEPSMRTGALWRFLRILTFWVPTKGRAR